MSIDPTALADLIHRLPKAELHCHLDGSLRASTLMELSEARGITLPAATPEALGSWMRVDDARNLEEYLARFEVTLAVMQTAAELERVAYEFVIDAALDGVRYIEARFCPALNTREGLRVDEVLDAVWRGLSRGERESGTVARVIVCALRSLPWPHAMEMAELAAASRDRGVVAFDLAGGELGNPAHVHAQAFDFARAANLAVTVHAGEGDGAGSIAEAVHRCAADQIGHGTRLHEDRALEAYVVDRRIPLEVCPTSNVQTRVTHTFAEHPLARYVALGAVVIINTDNRLMSGVTLSDEFRHCVTQLGFGADTIASLALGAFDAAFLPWAERQRLRNDAARDMAEWVRHAAPLLGAAA